MLQSVARFFADGGPFMFVNLVTSAVAVAIIVERVIALAFRLNLNAGPFMEQVQKLARRGVYPTAVLPEPSALLVDSGAQNMDLAIGLDLSTAYVESSNLNHRLRVLESLVLRIRQPGAICVFMPQAQRPAAAARSTRQSTT